MLALLFALPVALSQEYIVSAGEPVRLRVGCLHGPGIHTGDQWKVAFATNGSFWPQDLTQQTEEIQHPGAHWGSTGLEQDRKDTKDHAILRCPDGTYPHIASANVIEQNDSAYAWRYDENFSIIASTTMAEGDTTRNHNDMVMVCSRLGTRVAFPREARTNTFSHSTMHSTSATPFPWKMPPRRRWRHAGGRDQDLLYHTGTDTFQQQLVIRTYDANWQSVNYQTLDVIDAPMRPFWPQRLLQVGDKVLLALSPAMTKGEPGMVARATSTLRSSMPTSSCWNATRSPPTQTMPERPCGLGWNGMAHRSWCPLMQRRSTRLRNSPLMLQRSDSTKTTSTQTPPYPAATPPVKMTPHPHGTGLCAAWPTPLGHGIDGDWPCPAHPSQKANTHGISCRHTPKIRCRCLKPLGILVGSQNGDTQHESQSFPMFVLCHPGLAHRPGVHCGQPTKHTSAPLQWCWLDAGRL